MPRSYSYSVLCLSVRPSGESNREACFLSAEEGIFKAVVFGGPKSRLRSNVAPFNQGRIWIYHDPVRDSRKVTDFDVQTWRPGLREFYERVMAANSLAETVLATHAGGGSWEIALKLATDTLDSLENSDEKTCVRVLLHFFWKWADFLGVRPGLETCVCGAHTFKTSASKAMVDELLWYNIDESVLYCEKCEPGFAGSVRKIDSGAVIAVRPGACRWLLTVENLYSKDALRYSLDNSSLRQARNLILGILTETLGKRLPLWDMLEAI